MKNILIALLVLSNLSIPAYADQAVDLKKGQPAPYDGTLLDSQKTNNIKNELIQKDADEDTNASLNKSIILYKNNETIYESENELLLQHNNDLSKSLNDTKSLSDWEKVGFFVLGIVVTAVAVHEAGNLRK